MILVGYAAPSDHTFEAGTRALVDLLAAGGRAEPPDACASSPSRRCDIR
jgi:hypothetical protein